MLQWTELKEKQRAIVADLRASIHYMPSREADLLAFMRLYLKEDPERRPAILNDLRRCMDGQPYPNPFAAHRPYTQADAETCDRLLTGFLEALAACGGDRAQISREIDTLTTAVSEARSRREQRAKARNGTNGPQAQSAGGRLVQLEGLRAASRTGAA